MKDDPIQFTEAHVQDILARMQQRRILVVGDLMLDRFVCGKVSRISPEAPVPVVHVTHESAFPGGAANVARNLSDFGIPVSLAGIVGSDAPGQELMEALSEAGIGTEGIVQAPEIRTTVKTRVIARQQQVVRVDREHIEALSAAHEATILGHCDRLAASADGVIIEDYGKGLINQHMVDTLSRIAAGREIPLTADPTASNPIDWSGLSALKPNRHEAIAAAGLDDRPGGSAIDEAGLALLDRWDLEMLLVTLGEEGMCLFQSGQPPYHTPTRARDVYDVSGAGDTAIAFFTTALAAGCSGPEAAEIANHAAGIVVGKLGTATITPDELARSLSG
ncbi:MAG: D-glycero-beta-D-manno-heptose-7-phosphate kinase [Verrucomicrobia bacterium]|nr:D-glycero-beta-D-manno-heptose-7-phosphate kinase [Verrucomicrobiota bacterium]MDA1087902.1 D-glycero-beta-D-manno-heptose-7-phosphate kinase [Verrucomicrobiota bacterium]